MNLSTESGRHGARITESAPGHSSHGCSAVCTEATPPMKTGTASAVAADRIGDAGLPHQRSEANGAPAMRPPGLRADVATRIHIHRPGPRLALRSVGRTGAG